MSPQDETSSSSSVTSMKRRHTSSPVGENKRSPKQAPVYALPPPMVTCASPPSSSTFVLTTTAMPPSLSPVAYYPVYTTHTGHFYLASPPLHPTAPSAHHPTKILPKLPPNHQAPPTPVTLPASPSPSSSTPYSYYHHPYHTSPPIQQMYPSGSTPHTATTAVQREQARRQSHSAIEKRRREKLNDKIMQLKQLIPTCANQENLNKMSILQSTIDYITYLKDILEKADNAAADDDVDTTQGHQPIKLNWDLNNKNNKKKSGIETPPPLPSVVEPCTSQFSIQQTNTASSSKEDTQKQLPCLNDSTLGATKNMSLKNMLC